LFSDNINKVPRSILDQDINRDYISGSDIFLFPKVQGSGDSKDSKLQISYSSRLIDVISLGTIQEQDSEFDLTDSSPSRLSTSTNQSRVYKYDRGPLVAEIDNMKVLYSTGNNPDNIKGLTVFETEPFDSKLDIYYETSTTGLVTDLNWGLQLAPPASAPEESSILFSGDVLIKNFLESKTGGTIGTVIATSGSASNTLFYELLNLWSYSATGRDDFKNRVLLNKSTGVLTINSATINDGTGFAHRNSGYDKYDLVVKVSEYDGKDYVGSCIRTLQLQVTNDTPDVYVYAPDGTPDFDDFITAEVNFYERFNVTLDNGYKNTGGFNNGGTDEVENVNGMTFAVTFPNITNLALKEYAEKAFEVKMLVGGKFDVRTTWVYEFYDNFDKEPLNINDAEGLTKQDFFRLSDAERRMTVTGTDNAVSPLSDTVLIRVNEAIALVKMLEIRLYASLTKVRTAQLARGTSTITLDPLKPQVGNIVYKDAEFNKFAGSDLHVTTTKNLWVCYNYTKMGYNGYESKYDYFILDKDTSEIISLGTIVILTGNTATTAITNFLNDNNLSA
jgi:hypothetical protein